MLAQRNFSTRPKFLVPSIFFFIIIYPKQKSQGKNNKKKQILNACHLSGMFKGMNFVPLIREHIIQHSGAKWF